MNIALNKQKLKKDSRQIVIFAFIAVAMYSCQPNTLFDQVQSIETDGWSISNEIPFNFDVQDTNQLYSFFMHIRNDDSYRYSNLYVFMHTRFPNGNITRDTIECVLADPTGKWFGKGTGRFQDHKILLNPSIKFPLQGIYQIQIEQAMREEPLKGIKAVGIRIEQSAI
ncbi:MAG: gliding motility lipoprotein GldH [Bacteroidales bacterium]|nr:gliding motility lipoprotein GldH [Bacteroidales bacterium]